MVQKFPLFVNIHTIENVNAGVYAVKKSTNLVNAVCERSLTGYDIWESILEEQLINLQNILHSM